MSPCQVSSYKLATLCQVTSSARVATITRAMLTIMENEILNFLKRRSCGSKNKVRPVNPKTLQMEDSVGQSVFLKMKCWFAIFKRTKWTSRISKLFIELPNYLWNEVLWHWPLCFLAKKCPFPLEKKINSTSIFSFSGQQCRSSPYTIRYAHLPGIAGNADPPPMSLALQNPSLLQPVFPPTATLVSTAHSWHGIISNAVRSKVHPVSQ